MLCSTRGGSEARARQFYAADTVQRGRDHLVPAQPGILRHHFGLGLGTQHAAGDALQAWTQAVECLGGVVHIGIRRFARSACDSEVVHFMKSRHCYG